MKFIKLHHSIWTLGLSLNAFRTYCALICFMNTSTGYANVSMRKLAATVGISEKSVSRGVKELERGNVLRIIEKHCNGHRLANGYLITPQQGGFTMLPVNALTAPVSAAGFKAYAYLLKCGDKEKRAFPSLSGIASAIGVTVKTVIEQIKKLVKLKLLNKRHQIKKNHSFGHNQYHILDCIAGLVKLPTNKTQKEKTRPIRVSPQPVAQATLICSLILLLFHCFVKRVEAIVSPLKEVHCKLFRTSTRPIYLLKKRKSR